MVNTEHCVLSAIRLDMACCRQWKLDSPLTVPVSKKKNFVLNLNQYRNTHFQTLNKSKVVYKQLMTPQVLRLPKLHRITVTLVLYPRTKMRTDLDNVCSIHMKYLGDCLVELGVLEDDSYDYIENVEFKFGYVDKHNPRVEIIIKESKMKITFTLAEAIEIIRGTNEVFEDAEIAIEGTVVELIQKVNQEVTKGEETQEVKPKRRRRTKAEIEAEKNGVSEESESRSLDEPSTIEEEDCAFNTPVQESDVSLFEEAEDDEPAIVNQSMFGNDTSLMEEVNAIHDEEEMTIQPSVDDSVIDLTKPLFG